MTGLTQSHIGLSTSCSRFSKRCSKVAQKKIKSCFLYRKFLGKTKVFFGSDAKICTKNQERMSIGWAGEDTENSQIVYHNIVKYGRKANLSTKSCSDIIKQVSILSKSSLLKSYQTGFLGSVTRGCSVEKQLHPSKL